MKFIKTNGGYIKKAAINQAFVIEKIEGFYIAFVVGDDRMIERAIGSFKTREEAEKHLDNLIKELEELK